MSASRRLMARVLALAVVPALGLLSLATAPEASAHTVLLSTTPRAGASLSQPPREVTLTFEEPPLSVGSVVRVTGPGAQVVSAGSLRIVGATVHQPLTSGLRPGSYRVDWKVTSDDGHPVSDTFRFTVSGPSDAPASSSAATTAARPSGAGTWWPAAVLTALVLLAAGVVAVPRLRRLIVTSRARRKP